MISNVIMSGLLKEKRSDGFRYLEVSVLDINHKGKEQIFKIPLFHWTREKRTILTNLPDNSPVLIKGRVEANEEVGLYILVESIDCLRCETVLK